MKLKGPQAFPLQRLMMIVGRLCPGSLADLLEGRAASGVSSLLDASPSSRGGRGSADADGGGSMASTCPLDATAAMLGGISSLVSLRLLSAVGGDDGGGGGGGGGGDLLEGGRYVCNVPEALAAQLAADVNVQLSHYLRYA